jgi:hypothetical protein
MTLNPEFDLGDVKIYEHANISRAYLIRLDLFEGANGRSAIGVFPAEEFSELVDRDTVLNLRRLGLLCPVQRYSYIEGIKRAAAIARDILPKWREPPSDPWGYLRIRKGNAGKEVAMTPPIIEEVLPSERSTSEPEFLICDGNHRVLYNVWMARNPRPFPVVLIRGQIPEPYYAHPFGRYEWNVPYDNCVAISPSDTSSKYRARAVDRSTVRPDLAERSDLYRRYFRDFNTGFGDIGGQGGIE